MVRFTLVTVTTLLAITLMRGGFDLGRTSANLFFIRGFSFIISR
jgi:hypothetical protein